MGDGVSGRVALVYDGIAAEYAARNAAMPPELVAAGARFLALVGPGARVLDAGCGAGRDMAWLEGRGATVVGVDLSPGMLAQARAIARGDLVRLDMRHLAFAERCFGGVWCMASLLHLPKAAASAALGELRRVLVPGGPLCLGLQAGTGEGWERGPYGGVERFFARYRLPEAAALLREAGFAVAEQRNQGRSGARHWLQFMTTAPRA